ncbi:coiled-coil domain-containing protein 25 isoform X2 [Equus quagga]|uniref:coiled-coil domain-containing protein 25 isoform X2 n=1 Tax=Equus quagga TaxID=89248 RepID=UPI001EE1FEEE|nr:coiled-coil domain-containing protein 25 isoform X2 [Equus quagga]
MKVSSQKHLILKLPAERFFCRAVGVSPGALGALGGGSCLSLLCQKDEDLIKYGWPEDIWFHVDKLSSAHVYLRLHKGETIEDIPKEVLMDCAHLVKANSIQGCKMNNVNVVYTPWSNLKKTADMDVGQIGFHRQKDVKIVTVEKKVNEILNRLEKTKMERFPDLAAEKECRDREERNEKKAQIQEMKRREKEEMKKKREMDELRSYSSLMKVENMSSNQVVLALVPPVACLPPLPRGAGDHLPCCVNGVASDGKPSFSVHTTRREQKQLQRLTAQARSWT